MGSCCSSSTNKHHPSSSKHSSPPPLDLETVKEVLSQTPNPNPKTISSFPHLHQHHLITTSEILTANMTENVSTTSLDDDDDVYRRQLLTDHHRSPVKSLNRSQASGELRKSPVTRKELSPARVKPVQERNGRETGFVSTGRQRAASGSVSAARSRSPAKRTAAVGGGGGCMNEIGVGRSLSSRRTGKSPGRVGSDLQERVRKPEFRSGREREPSGRFIDKGESIENPLVSLECFIFL